MKLAAVRLDKLVPAFMILPKSWDKAFLVASQLFHEVAVIQIVLAFVDQWVIADHISNACCYTLVEGNPVVTVSGQEQRCHLIYILDHRGIAGAQGIGINPIAQQPVVAERLLRKRIQGFGKCGTVLLLVYV
jgi:hypothetical protein